jgi:hypothetical protein
MSQFDYYDGIEASSSTEATTTEGGASPLVMRRHEEKEVNKTEWTSHKIVNHGVH